MVRLEGHVWEHMAPNIQGMFYQFGPPDVMMLQCDCNNIGTMSLRLLQRFMEQTIHKLFQFLPNCRFVWFEILPRKYYRHMFSLTSTEKSRKRMNSALSVFRVQRGGNYISYPVLKSCSPIFLKDGVPQAVSLNVIQGGIFTIIRGSHNTFPREHLIKVSWSINGQFTMVLGKLCRVWWTLCSREGTRWHVAEF